MHAKIGPVVYRLSLLISVSTLAAACGGGGSSGPAPGGAAAGTIAFSTAWEQPATGASRTGAGTRDFGTTIPSAVDTVRITFESFGSDSGTKCCVAVTRGSSAFTDRRLELAQLPSGDAEITIAGYAATYAPADGFVQTCATVPSSAASSCDPSRDLAPSFRSDPRSIEIEPGITKNAGTINVFSSPFIIGESPAAGSVVSDSTVAIEVAVVDATSDVDRASIELAAFSGTPPSESDVALSDPTTRACDDAASDPASQCTPAGRAQVRGFVVEAVADPVAPGPVRVRVKAASTATPPRMLDTSYRFEVATTTTTSTTSTSTTTTSTTSTTSTTLPPLPLRCTLTFSVIDAFTLSALHFEATYQPVIGRFVGDGDAVACDILVGDVSTANHVASAGMLDIALVTGTSLITPVDVAVCQFDSEVRDLADDDFGLVLIEATRPDLVPVEPTVAITEVDCASGATSVR